MRNNTQWYGRQLFSGDKGNDALIWFKLWRPPIETLMNGSRDNYYAALQLMYPCMERMYQLKERKVGEKGLTKDVLKHFFPPEDDANEEQYNRIIRIVADELRHGLAHDAFVREGVELWDGIVCLVDSGLRDNYSRLDAVISAEFRTPILPRVDGKVIVNVKWLWGVVKSKIDNYYTSSDYLVNHYMQDDLVAIFNALITDDRGQTGEQMLKYLQESGIKSEDTQ